MVEAPLNRALIDCCGSCRHGCPRRCVVNIGGAAGAVSLVDRRVEAIFDMLLRLQSGRLRFASPSHNVIGKMTVRCVTVGVYAQAAPWYLARPQR